MLKLQRSIFKKVCNLMNEGYLIKRDSDGFITRWRQEKDIAEFVNIDTENSEYLWTREDFKEVLSQENVNSFVISDLGKVVGFLIYELTDDVIYILNLSIHSSYHRTGVATKLLNKLKNYELKGSRIQIQCDVRENNLAGHLFLKNNDFKAVSIIKDYFIDTYGQDEYEKKIYESAYSFRFNK